MLEVLITVLIISVGLLGIARLQTAGIRFNHVSYLKSQAALQAYDMADRLRENQQGVRAGAYDNLSGSTSDPGCIATACAAGELAQYDHYDWNLANTALLPAGQGSVARVGNFFLITVRWDGDRSGATGTGCDADSVNDLKCFRLRIRP
jgi:type IV pilus assembly protein PilV